MAKFERAALEVQCIPDFAEEAKSLHARVAELDRGFKTKASEVRCMRCTLDMEGAR